MPSFCCSMSSSSLCLFLSLCPVKKDTLYGDRCESDLSSSDKKLWTLLSEGEREGGWRGCSGNIFRCIDKIFGGGSGAPWSSGYERRLVFWRSWVRISASFTGWNSSHWLVVKFVTFTYLERPKINEEEAGDGPFKMVQYEDKYGRLPRPH